MLFWNLFISLRIKAEILSIVLLLGLAKRFAKGKLLLILATVLSKKVLFVNIGKLIYILSKTYIKAF